jgi:hypothetical protein
VEVEFEVGIWRLLLGKMTVVISHSYSKTAENCKIPVAVLPLLFIIRAIEVGAALVLAHDQHCLRRHYILCKASLGGISA